MDKRYEKAWVRGLRNYFAAKPDPTGGQGQEPSTRLMRRGDIFGVPVWLDESSLAESDDEEDDEEEDDRGMAGEAGLEPPASTAIVYFRLTAIHYEPLVALEDDFRSSISSKARAGELGCWIDVGPSGSTQMVLEGLERERVAGRRSEELWHALGESTFLQSS